jgi:hypothetical protein
MVFGIGFGNDNTAAVVEGMQRAVDVVIYDKSNDQNKKDNKRHKYDIILFSHCANSLFYD